VIPWGVNFINAAEGIVKITPNVFSVDGTAVDRTFLGRAIALPSIAFLGWVGWGLGATLLSHFITGLLHA
jgi:hypothetical protein